MIKAVNNIIMLQFMDYRMTTKREREKKIVTLIRRTDEL